MLHYFQKSSTMFRIQLKNGKTRDKNKQVDDDDNDKNKDKKETGIKQFQRKARCWNFKTQTLSCINM